MASTVSWPAEKSVDVRVQHAVALARGLTREDLSEPLRLSIEGALGLAAEDPSPRVRLALAEAIGSLAQAPLGVIAQLAPDRPDIAGLVIARSPVVVDRDIPDLATRLDPRLLPTLATRVSSDGCARTVLSHGCSLTAVALLLNPDVPLSGETLEMIAEEHGEHAKVREVLLGRDDLPITARFALVDRLCAVLSTSSLVQNILGEARSRTILDDAQGLALVHAASGRSRGEVDVLVAQLAERASIDALILLRALLHGEHELFSSLLSRLADVGPRRVRAILRARRASVLRALLDRCGIAQEPALLIARAYELVGTAGFDLEEATGRLLSAVQPDDGATATMLNAVRRWRHEARLGHCRGIANAA